jgi:hypothetical protein
MDTAKQRLNAHFKTVDDLTNIKHFPCWYTVISTRLHEWELGKREIVWKHDARNEGRSVFTQFRVFPVSTSVDITVYQYGKKFLY